MPGRAKSTVAEVPASERPRAGGGRVAAAVVAFILSLAILLSLGTWQVQRLFWKHDLIARIEAMTPLRRLADPEEVANAILFLAGPGASMVTGHTLPVDGGFLAQ